MSFVLIKELRIQAFVSHPDPQDRCSIFNSCMPTVLLPVMRVAVTPLLTRPAPCWLRLRPLRLRKDGRVDPGAGRIYTLKIKQLLKECSSLAEYNTYEGIS